MNKLYPALALALLLSACSGSSDADANAASTSVAEAKDATTLSTGTFSGRNDHVVTGKVELVHSDEGHFVVLADDFSLDGAPDPKVGFGKDGEYDATALLSVLEKNTGKQTYAVPDGIDATQFNEVYIWCDEFSVALGVATLE